jgi:hypothetical protein
MRLTHWLVPTVVLAVAVLLPAESLAGVATVSSSTCTPGVVPGYLAGVAATSSTNAWAAGYYTTSAPPQTLVEHWNGTAWCRVPSPNPGGAGDTNRLQGVAAVSPSSAWGVGFYGTSTRSHTLVVHWNGTAWKQQTSPNPAGFSSGSQLLGAAAASPTDAWAVGSPLTTSPPPRP